MDNNFLLAKGVYLLEKNRGHIQHNSNEIGQEIRTIKYGPEDLDTF